MHHTTNMANTMSNMDKAGMSMQNVLMTVQHCEAMCEHMITHILRTGDYQSRALQLQFLRDCADICTLMAKYLARSSSFSKVLAATCAYICQTCGSECMKFQDAESQRCGQICLHCAQECNRFASA